MSRYDRQPVRAACLALARHRGAAGAVPALTDPAFAQPAPAHRLLQATGYHGIVPLLHDALQHTAADDGLTALVAEEYKSVVARGMRLDSAANVVARELAGAGIGCTFFKGSALAYGYYPRPQLRFGSDVDVLVAPGDLARADEVLRRAGAQELGRGWRGQQAVGLAECSYLVGEYGQIDLHWSVLPDQVVRESFRLPPEPMIERSRTVAVRGTHLPVLDYADMLLTVAMHACFSGGFRLGWMVDLAVLAESEHADWDEVRRRAADSGTGLASQVMLDRAERRLGPFGRAPLATGAWRAAMARVDPWWPVERAHEQVLRGAFVYRATRSTTRQSVARLVREIPWDGFTRYNRRRRSLARTERHL